MARKKIQSATDQRKFTMVYNDFLESDLLNANEKLVFIILKKFTDNDGSCFPSINKICKLTGLTRKTIIKILKSLELKEVLQIKNRISEEKGNQSNIYILYDFADIWIKKESLTEDTTDQSTTSQSSNNNSSADSILPTGEKSQDSKAFSRDMLNELYDFDILVENNKTTVESINSIMELLLDVLNSKVETIRVNKEDKSASIVKGRLLKLNYMHIQYVLDEVGKQVNLIKNKRAYLITSLYNSYTTLETHVTNRVNHDMQE